MSGDAGDGEDGQSGADSERDVCRHIPLSKRPTERECQLPCISASLPEQFVIVVLGGIHALHMCFHISESRICYLLHVISSRRHFLHFSDGQQRMRSACETRVGRQEAEEEQHGMME